MSKVVRGHPGEERLLRLADGELTPRESAEVRDHLEACWECRAGMETIQAAVADCVHYRKSVVQAQLPPPPAPWRNLSAGFAAIDREIAGEASWWRQLWQGISTPKFWVPAVAAGLIVTFVLLPWLRVTPTVQAAELLRRAVVAAESRPRVPAGKRKLQVRTKSKKLFHSAAAVSAEMRPVAALFESARYDWGDPLSAKAYSDWQGQLASKTSEVIPEGDAFYQVTTRSNESELTEATLRLRQGDLQPVQGMFKFRGDEWVELTEVPAEPEMVASSRVSPAIPAPAPVGVPVRATVADELRVLEALHRIGADLGDPIEIARAGERVEVKGFGIDARRRAQIEQALRAMPLVNLNFVDESAPVGLSAAGPALAVKPATSPASSFLGGVAAVEKFTNEVVDRQEQIMARAHAIQRLGVRFSDPSSLGAADLAVYRSLQRSHTQALVKLEQELAGVLRPVTLSTAPPPGNADPATPTTLLQAARRLERSISILLGAAPLVRDTEMPVTALADRIAAEQAALSNLTRTFMESMGQ